MERTATGVTGFDELIEGGLPKGSNILLTGAPGAGKSIFGLQYLIEGAKKGENGLYITLDSSVEVLRIQARQFEWDVDNLEKEGKIFFLRVPLTKMKLNLFDMIENINRQINAQRIVFDNLATFSINIDLFTIPLGYAGNVASSVSMSSGNPSKESGKEGYSSDEQIFYAGNSEKRMIYLIIEELATLGTTNLIITYGNQEGEQVSTDGVSEFACDGIIQLFNQLIGVKRVRSLTVLKMRDTKHSQYVHDFDITDKGIIIKPAEQLYK